MFSVVPYITPSGKDVVAHWLDGLRDYKAAARILARLEKLRDGHFGDCKPLKSGVWELRIDVGPGYRLYYSRVGREVILLLLGGDKRGQSRDIAKAIDYLTEYQRRKP